MHNVHRQGHSAILGNNGTTHLIGGYGKVAPDVQAITTKRLLAPLTLDLLPKKDGEVEQAVDFNYIPTTTNTTTTKNNNTTQFYPTATTSQHYIHQPIPREHHHQQAVTTPQLPLFLYFYFASLLNQQRQQQPQQPVQNTISTSAPLTTPTFSMLYGGRLSPTTILDDMWLCCHELNTWVQVLPPNTISFSTQDGGALIPFQSMLCSVPMYTTSAQGENQHVVEVMGYAHVLLVGQKVYQVEITNPTQLTTTEIKPTFTITQQLTPQDYPTFYYPVGSGAGAAAAAQQQQEQQAQFSSFETLAASLQNVAPALNNMTCAPINTDLFTDIAEDTAQRGVQWPIARYKGAMTSRGGKLYLHGGRSGFATNWDKKKTTTTTTGTMSSTKERSLTFVRVDQDTINDEEDNDFILQEAIWPLSAFPLHHHKVQLEAEQRASGVAKAEQNKQAEEQQPEQQESEQSEQSEQKQQQLPEFQSLVPPKDALIVDTTEPYFTSLLLNDLWVLDVQQYPFVWSRVDQCFDNNEDNILPSHRYSHAAVVVDYPTTNAEGVDVVELFLVISGGLVLKSVPHDELPSGLPPNTTALSSHHQSLVPSSSLFFINITQIQDGVIQYENEQENEQNNNNTNNNNINNHNNNNNNTKYNAYYYIPSLLPYAMTTYNDTTMSVELSLPNTLHVDNRHFDIYGHTLHGLTPPPTNTNTTSCDEQIICTLVSIGGTSHTCLAGASVMSLDLTREFFKDMIAQHNDVEDITTQLQWTPCCKPVIGALFLRHTSTVLSTKKQEEEQQEIEQKQEQQQQITTQYNILIAGGGALCFSFGSYTSPAFLLQLTITTRSKQEQQSENQQQNQQKQLNNPPSAAGIIMSLLLTTTIPLPPPEQVLNKYGKPKQQQKNHDKYKLFKPADEKSLTVGVEQKCTICGEVFASKNKLFKHITITGHKLPAAQ